ncbi:T9SS type A sorting domain-containing protein [Winogradskyella flava]|uniref:T9SS type A sorting domain-containing protein n=1 Tax=Winogradskyella flava TaxID=1884876 RepID=A0A842IWD1_9FLAO|nr:T9SS type A sorting domain-containing protein [Winogradskyella flava]MBC2846429.1 T9SS type A sorting domain-containing protein [Winogradskyella flava]
MKKITLLITTLVFSTSLMLGQTVLSEDFESGLSTPTGWTNNDIAGGGDIWTFANGGDAVGYTSPNTIYYVNGELAGNYALFDSDGYGNNTTAEDAALESPIFDCSGLTSVTLSFNHFFTAGFGGQGFVEVSTDGVGWSQVASYSGVDQAASSFGFESIDVSADLAGAANAQVRFRWTGDYAWGWAVDNVSVFQCTVNAPNAVTTAIMPSNGATGVTIAYGDPRNLGPIEWAPPSSGDAADSYNISLGANTAGDDIGLITGFSIGNSINFNWQPNTTYYWFIEAVNCAGVTAGPVFSFTTEACTDTIAPPAATAPIPGDAATNVTIDANGNSLTFSWTGDPDVNYTLNLDTANPPVQNSFNNFENGGEITGLAENTTYFWSLDPINCFGETTGPVWSFTTGLALSTSEEEFSTFSVSPNPVSDILNIKSAEPIDNVIVYDLTGRKAAHFNKGDIFNSSINISNLSQGLYLVKITAGTNTQTIKVTKQ